MSNDGYYAGGDRPGGRQPGTGLTPVSDVPLWLVRAIQVKDPRISVALADSTELRYSELDKKLLEMAAHN